MTGREARRLRASDRPRSGVALEQTSRGVSQEENLILMNKTRIAAPLMAVMLAALMAVGLQAAVTFNGTGVPVTIPDNNLAGVNSTANVAGLSPAPPWPLTDANVNIVINTPWPGDIDVTLDSPVTPAGIALWNDCGSSGALPNPTVETLDVTLDDDSATAFPFCGAGNGTPGNYGGAAHRTETGTALNTFDGQDAAGVWTLNVVDDSAICTGTLTSWSLTLDGPPPLPVELMDFDIR